MKKKILFLGGAHTQVAPLIYAKSEGHYVITCDYLPNNPGHFFADESFNISTTDKTAILKLAKKLKIDGIVAYGSDPAAPTAAFVAERMGLPGNPYQAVLTLARKDLFREFLKKNGFNVPNSRSFKRFDEARSWIEKLEGPLFVKPIDSSGSKGVSRLLDKKKAQRAFAHALSYSREKMVVIEEEITRSSYQMAGDGFLKEGNLVFRCWADEHFDPLCNGLVPIGQTFPTSQPEPLLSLAHAETQRLVSLLKMRNGALNFDVIFDESGELYFLELGPRNGGCLIPEVIRYATGIDLVKFTVDSALGLPCHSLDMQPTLGFWASYMIHSTKSGVFKEIWMSERLKSKIVEENIWIKPNTKVKKFLGSDNTLGTMILKFSSMADMEESLENMEKDIKVITY